ncbi:U6 snRNA phosphodiesterase Usb1 [Podospora aff. communis PSN243]|uniref:U6 snRNA phosphodiesterase n=1 Tax=Podospora aff. communis PSN243 TaxID=3040156 RepID=A0AAV9G5L9_9PEZI|nr:U6 snRNA phosphodiesterase Usb1 [Podospora aff. communis PSN243]
MALVDYASDSSASSTDDPPPKKRPRLVPSPRPTSTPAPKLPPLPPAFHDLYASTVRTATSDDPALHQGRTRQISHVVGNWPSHIYVEWHPPSETQTLLTSLLSALQEKLPPEYKLSTFLTSDLGAPLPLHISLSRPLSLTTADKDGFLSKLVSNICNTRIAPFSLLCRGVEWHHTDESGRSFLVLRVQSQSSESSKTAVTALNPELTKLLRHCNAVADEHGQPQLYQWALKDDDKADGINEDDDRAGRAFHVSIAWSFAKPTEELMRLTEEVFGDPKTQDRIHNTQIHVDGMKAKIGNVVTHIPLPQAGKRAEDKSSKNLFGI